MIRIYFSTPVSVCPDNQGSIVDVYNIIAFDMLLDSPYLHSVVEFLNDLAYLSDIN